MNECIICLDTTKDVYKINSISNMNKTCDCEYYCHILCVKDWIYDNPSCLLCNKLMYLVEEDDNIDTSYRYISNENIIIHAPPPPPNIVAIPGSTDEGTYSPPPPYHIAIGRGAHMSELSDSSEITNTQSQNNDLEGFEELEENMQINESSFVCNYIIGVTCIFCIVIIVVNVI